jgi:uncharacterized protein YaaN involved in tellurite resistance
MDELSHRENIYGVLTDDEKTKLREIQELINFSDSSTIAQFGASVQGKIANFAETILSEVRAKDTEYVGKILTDLMLRLRDLHIEGFPGKGGKVFSKIPFVGPLVDNTKRYLAKYQTLSVQIMKIVEELEHAKARLLQDVAMLDKFYERNLEYFKEINLYILAGNMKLTELQEVVLPKMEAGAERSKDVLETQRYKDLVQLAHRLEKKLHDLTLSRTLSLHAGPQIRLVQNNNQELAEKIQSSVLTTVPLWKNQLVIAISLLRQRQALDLQKEVSAATRELLERNAEMLKEGSKEIAMEAEKGIVDIETLKKVNASLISTIDETIKVQQEGKMRRGQAREEIEKIERELRETMLRIKEIQTKTG